MSDVIETPAPSAAPAPPPDRADGVAEAIAARRAALAAAPVVPEEPVVDPEALPEAAAAEEVPELTPEEVEAAEAARRERLVEFPDWSPSEPAMELEVDDPQVAQRIRALVNARELKSESQARLNEAAQEMARVNELRARWRVDPVGMATEALSPQQRMHLTMSLLTEPQMFDGLQETLHALLTDPHALAVVRANLKANAYELAERSKREVQVERAQERNLRDLRRTVEALTPPGLTAEQRRVWRADALSDLGTFAERNNLRIIHPEDVPVALAHRLRASSVDAQAAVTTVRNLFTRRDQDSAGASSGPPASPSAPVAHKLVAAAKVRQAASTSAPSGAGATTAAVPRPPKTAGIKESIQHYRQTRGIPRG